MRGLVAGLATLGLACSNGPLPQGPLADGEIRRSCAPWDGPALRITVVADSSGESLTLYLYRRGGAPDRGRYRLGGADREGSALRCPSQGDCALAPGGEVWLRAVTEGRPVEGWYRIERETGGTVDGRFGARWGAPEGPCG